MSWKSSIQWTKASAHPEDYAHFRLQGEVTVAGVRFTESEPIGGDVLEIGKHVEWAKGRVVARIEEAIKKRREAATQEFHRWQQEMS